MAPSGGVGHESLEEMSATSHALSPRSFTGNSQEGHGKHYAEVLSPSMLHVQVLGAEIRRRVHWRPQCVFCSTLKNIAGHDNHKDRPDVPDKN